MSGGSKNYIKEIIDANVPQLAGSVAAWYNFKDKPYAMALAMEQVTHAFGQRTILAIGFDFLLEAMD